MKFHKWHGLGNDFIIIDNLEDEYKQTNFLVKRICDRHFGIGADGLVFIKKGITTEYNMQIFNNNGSQARMCGNAARCFVKHLYKYKYIKYKSNISFETLSGLVVAQIFDNDKICIDLGKPNWTKSSIPMLGREDESSLNKEIIIDNKKLIVHAIHIGEPHCVSFVEDISKISLENLAQKIEKYPIFPRGTNVEFVQIMNPSEIYIRIWERGVGSTLACGTGAAASVVVGNLLGKTKKEVKVKMEGGTLDLMWGENNHILKIGDAQEVFYGEIL